MNKPCWLPSNAALACLALFATLHLASAADSLWRSDARPIVADKKAGRVGDLITIVVQQSSTTTKKLNTTTAKSASTDAAIDTFFYSPKGSSLLTKGGQMPAVKWSSKNDFAGGGSIDNSDKMIDRIAVRIVDTQPNGNLVLEGTRRSAFSGEKQDVLIRGTVRPEDVSANNTVFSYNLADATLTYVSKGAVSDSQRKGFLTKIWDKVSPF